MLIKSIREWLDSVGSFNGGISAHGGSYGMDTIETEYGSQEHGYYPPDQVSKAKTYYIGNAQDDFNEDKDSQIQNTYKIHWNISMKIIYAEGTDFIKSKTELSAISILKKLLKNRKETKDYIINFPNSLNILDIEKIKF